MLTTYVALLPAVVAVYVARRHSVTASFLWVYIPALLLLPDYYLALTPGLPDPSAAQAVAVAIFAVHAVQGLPGYRFGATDILVATYSLAICYSQFRATGFADAQNVMFFQLGSVGVPYLLAKSLIEPNDLGVAFARQVVFCALLVTLLNLYENRFGVNLWQRVLGPLFPGFGEGWVTTFRFGIARAAGPYGHALFAGIVMLVAYRLQRWLHWARAWQGIRPRYLPFKLDWALTVGMGAGLLTTFAKGAILAAVVAAVLPVVGRSRQRRIMAGVAASGLAFVGIPAVIAFLQWASVGRMHALSDNQETAAYRYELVVKYLDIAHQQMWFGWGLNQWPRVANMPSIDNFYLALYLMHGMVASVAFASLMLSLTIRLLVRGMKLPLADPPGSELSFTLASILFAYLLAIATVYMGLQTVPLLFLIAGWAESYLARGVSRPNRPGVETLAPSRYRFRRVVVDSLLPST
jgi:hypothetical protein